jgi:hypothetical protein
METEKKQWAKPELIVLVRSKPEEAVLDSCKGKPGTSGADSANSMCLKAECISPCLGYVDS